MTRDTRIFETIVAFIKGLYGGGYVVLHEPRFLGNEKEYLVDCLDSTYVSSVGRYVDRFERMVEEYTGAKHSVAVVNGTAALHVALKLAGVGVGDEVITQPVTFVATCNAIAYCGAEPVFVDVDRDNLGLSPESLKEFLESRATVENDGLSRNKFTGKIIRACVPVHTFGQPARIDELGAVCKKYGIELVEDAAESLGSKYGGKHTGTFGRLGIYSLNGNKTITCGGGGVIVTDDDQLARRAKHVTTTAKVFHPYEYVHDEVGYNYRLPNLNAALACAQMENLEMFIEKKREVATAYCQFFADLGIGFMAELEHCRSNYWLNAVIMTNKEQRDAFLDFTNKNGVMTRPIWCLMNKLEMYKHSQSGSLENAEWLYERVVNIPSSVIVK